MQIGKANHLRMLSPDNVAHLIVQLNRYFLLLLILLLTVIGMGFTTIYLSKQVAENREIVWVKLSPDGTWYVDEDQANEVEFYKATIDYMLVQYVTRRYQEIPYSIKSDYGFAHLMMAPGLGRQFQSVNGFDAATKAAKLSDCGNCNQVRIDIRSIYHYDSDVTQFGQVPGRLYRSNVYINRLNRSADNATLIGQDKLIVALQWRLLSKQEIPGDVLYLRLNPIGLQVLNEEILNDAS